MPNHCSNLLTVTGAASELATFCNYALQKDADDSISSCPDLHYLYPIPEGVTKADDPGILSTEEYNWRKDHWGTKWNTYSNVGLGMVRSDISNRLIGIQCSFETAWAPPTGAIRVGSVKFPNLNFTLEYAEAGVMFRGVAFYKNGKEYFDHIEDNLTDKEWESPDYTKMDDKNQIRHVEDMRRDINPDTIELSDTTEEVLSR